MKCIKLFLGDHEVGRAYEDRFVDMVPPNPFGITSKIWYDNSFFGIVDSDTHTFSTRFQLAIEGQYFCFSKLSLKLYACDLDE